MRQDAPTSSATRAVKYDARLVERCVDRVVESLLPIERVRFHRDREAAYTLRDPDEREAAFDRAHRQWFVKLRLGAPLEGALEERPDVTTRVAGIVVVAAASRFEEGADLVDEPGGASARRLVIRLLPESLTGLPVVLLTFLRHELTHVGDMLDPAFGYRPMLPTVDVDPAYERILHRRYAVVWDTTIDGRLFRRGLAARGARDTRLREFRETFPALGSRTDVTFASWFDLPDPTHEQIARFISDRALLSGRCPICRCPAVTLDPRPERLSPEALSMLREEHPRWREEEGLCCQCADLFEARRMPPRTA